MKKIIYLCLIANIVFITIGLYKIFTHDYSHGLFLLLTNGFSLLLNFDVLKRGING
jgi:hypothetical protein